MVKQIDTIKEFLQLLEHSEDRLVLVMFSASWCGPCIKILPPVVSLVKKHKEIKFVKVDVDINEDVAEILEITSMPTFVFFEKGHKIAKVEGANLSKVKKIIEKYLDIDEQSPGNKHRVRESSKKEKESSTHKKQHLSKKEKGSLTYKSREHKAKDPPKKEKGSSSKSKEH